MIASLVFAGEGGTPVAVLRFEEGTCGCTKASQLAPPLTGGERIHLNALCGPLRTHDRGILISLGGLP